MCRLMQVSKSGYYYWKNSPMSQRSKQNHYLLLQIIKIYRKSFRRYGSPKIHRELIAQGISCSVNRVARIMQKHNIKAVMSTTHKRSHEATNTSGFTSNILDRNFKADKPNQKWVSDTTFIGTKQGWLYLAVIMDLYSRKIIGWSMSQRNNTQFVSKALEMAINSKSNDDKVLLHSDQGATYRANDYLALFKKHNITQSMSNKGKCHDNAVIESFFSRLKTELIQLETYQTREIAKSKIFEYIQMFNNKVRRHSYLNYETPENFEKQYYNTVSQ